MLKKGLVFGIVLLFIGSGVISSNASNVTVEKSSKTANQRSTEYIFTPLMWTENFSTFFVLSQRHENDQIYYMIDWGDGTNTGWIGPYPSGQTISISHIWTGEDTYKIKARSKIQDETSWCATYSFENYDGFKFFYPSYGYAWMWGTESTNYVFTFCAYGFSYCMFDWGDGSNSGWLGPNDTIITNKSWNSTGIYDLRFKLKDMYGYETDWSEPYPITISLEFYIPTPPVIEGPKFGKVGKEYNYTFCSKDLDSDELLYWVDWGDGSGQQEYGPFGSGEPATISHTWTTKGKFTIRSAASDYWFPSDWSTFPITMPRTISFDSPFLKFLDRFPHAFPILRHLLKL